MICILFGLIIIVNPRYYHRGIDGYFDLSDIKFPLSLIMVSVGVVFIWSTKRKGSAVFYACCKCGTIFHWKDTKKKQCIKCGGNIENIKGFYDRHPELKKIRTNGDIRQ